MLQGLATGLMLAGAQFVATWVLDSEAAVTLLFIALIAPAVLLAPVWQRVARRIGKERGFRIASLVFAAAALSMVVLVWAPGPWVYLPVAVAGAAYAGMQSLPMAMLPDVISHDARQTGARPCRQLRRRVDGGRDGRHGARRDAAHDRARTHRLHRVGRRRGRHAAAHRDRRHRPRFSVVPAALVLVSVVVLRALPAATGRRERRCRGIARMEHPMTELRREASDILAELEALRAADAPTHGGRVLSYVYDSGVAELDELAGAAARLVQPVNGLDPTTFTSVAAMEARRRRLRAPGVRR